MTAPEKAPSRVIDWAAIRKAYETSDDPVRVIAWQHGINERTVQRQRLRENWLKRRDRLRLAKGPEIIPLKRHVGWAQVKREYEEGEYSVWEIRGRHGIGQTSLYRRRNLENWKPRCGAAPTAYGAGGKVNAAVRLKALLVKKLVALEQHLQLDERIDPAEPLKGMLTLAGALEKILDIEAKEKRRDDGDRAGRLIINDATREALALRIEALVDSWEAAGDSGGT